MKRRRYGNLLFLLISFDAELPGAELSAQLARILESYGKDERLRGIPLHWNFPARMIERVDRSIWTKLRTRIAAGIDLYVPSGYSGLPHALMLPADVSLDLSWSVEDPDKHTPRISEEVAPTIIFPQWHDTRRAAVREIYSTLGAPLILSDKGVGELFFDRSPVVPISFVEFAALSERPMRRLLRRTAKPGAIVIRLPGEQVASQFDDGTIPSWISDASEREKSKFGLLSDLISGEEVPSGVVTSSARLEYLPTINLAEADRFSAFRYSRAELNQASRRASQRTAQPAAQGEAQRSGRGADQDERKKGAKGRKEQTKWEAGFRDRTGSYSPSDADSKTRFVGSDRVLVSDMSGSVLLSGDRVSGVFDSGHLVEVRGDEGSAILAAPSQSWIESEGLRELFSLESAFSFDETGIRGIQERLTCRTRAFADPVQLQLDAFFMDGEETLFFAVGIEFPFSPYDRNVGGIGPFSISLELQADNAVISSRYPDGERTNLPFGPGFQSEIVWGAGFEIPTSTGIIHIFSPEEAESALGHLFVRRIGRRTCELSIGAVNGLQSAASIAGKRRSWLFCIDVAKAGTSRSSTMSRKTIDRLAQTYSFIRARAR